MTQRTDERKLLVILAEMCFIKLQTIKEITTELQISQIMEFKEQYKIQKPY
jgi:hypothetical protein